MINQEEFVRLIQLVVTDESIKSVQANLAQPPGRSPRKEMVEMSKWFNELDSIEKDFMMTIVKEAVETTVFGFFCVLDGVRSIENDNDKGLLELFYSKGGSRILLNDPASDNLHELL